MKNCTIRGCDDDHYARGWCVRHYMRWYRTGDVGPPRKLGTRERRSAKLSERDVATIRRRVEKARRRGRINGYMKLLAEKYDVTPGWLSELCSPQAQEA